MINNLKLYITSSRTDPLVEKFIVNIDNDKRNMLSLQDNPFTYNKLKSISYSHAVLWLDNNNPVYGYFICQYPELGPNIARMFVRNYKIGKPMNRKFIVHEHTQYAKCLKPVFEASGIDTLFFTRHVTKKTLREVKWKSTNYSKGVKFIMGKDISIRCAGQVKFKGFNQILYYYNAYQDKPVDLSFIEKISKVK